MPRIPFYEKIKNREIDISIEITKMHQLFTNFSDADILFPHLDNKMGCYDAYEFMNLLERHMDWSSQFTAYLDYCDFFLILERTAIKYAKWCKANRYSSDLRIDYSSVLEGITFVLDKLDYQIIDNKKGAPFVALKDTVAEEVAGMSEFSDIKWRVLEYNGHNTSLKDKKAILSELYKKFELLRPNLKKTNGKVASKLGELIQLVRHSKDEKKESKYAFFYQNEEEWCDKIYDLLLECFLHSENEKVLDEIITLEEGK